MNEVAQMRSTQNEEHRKEMAQMEVNDWGIIYLNQCANIKIKFRPKTGSWRKS
jgi:hypothetical protein